MPTESRGLDHHTNRAQGIKLMELGACQCTVVTDGTDNIFKVSGGKIHEIEAMGFRTDYQSPTGWETHAGH